jgi:O-antigen ligase
MSRKILEFGLVAAILIAVGGFGGTEPVSWGFAEMIVMLLGILLLALTPRISAIASARLLALSVALLAWVGVQWFASRYGRIGFDRHAIETSGLALATSIVAFFVVCEVARERESRIRLALCLIGLGLFEAFYGLAEYLAGWQYIWNVPRRFYLGSATGTYVNHNHFAGLLEMILPLALGLAFYFWQGARHRSRRPTWRSFLEFSGRPEIVKCFLLLLVAAVLLVSIVFSFSRMGVISVLASLGTMAAIVWIGRRRSRLPVALILLLLTGGIATAVWVGVGPVVDHFEQLPQNEPLVSTTRGRVAVWNDSLKLVRAHPWTGIGLGCFEYAFTAVQSTQLTYVVDHAHNDYLEFAAELGLPFASILLIGILWLAAVPLRASLRARSTLTRALALGSFGAVLALLVHGIADFNFYIPANALVFAVILGIGYADSQDQGAAEFREPRSG